MDIFNISHALTEIECIAKERGLYEGHLILFYMWLSDDRFPGHTFDDAFISKVLKDMKSLVKEFEKWAEKEAAEALQSESEPL